MNNAFSVSLAVLVLVVLPSDGQEAPDIDAAPEKIEGLVRDHHYPIKLTIGAVDAEGHAIENANVRVGIDSLVHADGFNHFSGQTSKEGLFTVEGRGRGSSEIYVWKDGYYVSRAKHDWDGRLNPGGPQMHQQGGFKPWNPLVEVDLVRIGNPVPLHVYPADGKVGIGTPPAVATKLAYDLFVGDWMPPFGEGKVSDIQLELTGSFLGQEGRWGEVTMEFVNEADGLLPIEALRDTASPMKLPALAPTEGYELRRHHDKRSTANANQGPVNFGGGREHDVDQEVPAAYFMRIRTQRDSAGKIESAYFGKVTTPLTLELPDSRSNKPKIRFTYYLNPNPNDRNLEFDRKTNLVESCEIPARNLAP